MKKVVLFLVIIAMAAPVFAQDMGTVNWDGNRRMAVMINPLPLFIVPMIGGFGIGAGFEYAPSPFFSIKPFVNILNLNQRNFWDEEDNDSLFMLRFSTEARWYPLGNFVHGLFTNLGLQYHLLNQNLTDVDIGTFHTLGIFWGVGYKFVWGRSRAAFVVEPTIEHSWVLTTSIPEIDPLVDHAIGWLLGIRWFRVGLKVGVAF